MNAIPSSASLALLARADLLQLLAKIFQRPSARNQKDLAIADADRDALASQAMLAARPEAAAAFAATLAAAQAVNLEDWTAEYSRLFEAAGICPPNETIFVRRDKGAILADIAGFHAAFGFALAEDAGEKGDHLVAELEFVALLLVMLAQAREKGDEEHIAITQSALRSFASDHLDAWLPLFAQRLAEVTALPLYRQAAATLHHCWEQLVAQQGLPRAVGEDAGYEEDAESSPYECDAADRENS